ncbi:MAG TPA: SDR family oxidoreductase [Thermoanaerobaculia bacterium]|jgi:short-subunit dehydrogenase
MTVVAVVTGASSGLGLEMATLLRARDFSVVGVARRGPEIKGDASRRETALAALEEARRRGNIKMLVNCAGIGIFHPAGTYTDEEIERVISSNLLAMINFCETFLSSLREGTIVNVMSTAALTGKPGETVYCAAKWGARGYTEALRAEVKGTRVLAVYPGGMRTPFWHGDPKADTFMDPKDIAAKIVAAVFDSDVGELVIRRP